MIVSWICFSQIAIWSFKNEVEWSINNTIYQFSYLNCFILCKYFNIVLINHSETGMLRNEICSLVCYNMGLDSYEFKLKFLNILIFLSILIKMVWAYEEGWSGDYLSQ